MSEFRPRPTAAIDADLRALGAVVRDAQRKLVEVRRRQRELADVEAELVVAVELRVRRIDDMLDERLHAVRDAGELLRPRPIDHVGLAGVR